MNSNNQNTKTNINKLLALAITAILLSACADKVPEGARAVRDKLTKLKSDSQLANLAPVAISEANDAVIAAEKPRKSNKEDQAAGHYLVFVADHKVDAARAQAQKRLSEDQCEKAGVASRHHEAHHEQAQDDALQQEKCGQ